MRFPPFPTCRFALAFPTILPKWFEHISIDVLFNAAKPPRKRVTSSKYVLGNYPGYIHVDIERVRLNVDIQQGIRLFLLHHFSFDTFC